MPIYRIVLCEKDNPSLDVVRDYQWDDDSEVWRIGMEVKDMMQTLKAKENSF